MPKRAILVVLSEEEQTALVQLTKRHKSGQQLVLRAWIVLAAGEGKSNAKIAQELSIRVGTVCLWRDRWVARQGIVKQISRRHAARLLKKGAFNRIGSAIG